MKVKEVLEKINYDNYETIYISNERGENLLDYYSNEDGEVPLMIGILNMSEEIEQMEVKYYHCDFGEIYIVVKDNTYGCDKCGERKDYE